MAAHKSKMMMDAAEDSGIYKKSRKRYLEGRGISCGFCKYHRGENLTHKYQRSWKKTSKRKHQSKQ